MEQPDFYTLDQIATRLQISVETVRVYLRRKTNRLPSYRIGKEYRVSKVDFEKWLEAQRNQDSEE